MTSTSLAVSTGSLASYLFGCDVWEGALDVDEELMKQHGLVFMVIRINDMLGGLHRDENFEVQWYQARNLIRWPYFVYNPWASQFKNYAYLKSLMPIDAKHVSLDIEVKYDGRPPDDYAKEVLGFVGMCLSNWTIDIYTGLWFLPYLSSWPDWCDYWWARYPLEFYPKSRVNWTWEVLGDNIHCYLSENGWKPGPTPGPCKLWQITGDRIILPGTADRAMDINVFKGSFSELEAYAGMSLRKPMAHSIHLPVVFG